MEERAKMPVTAPRANPTVSYWQDPPDALADHRTTPDLPSSADTVIIGSGITGAAVAWKLLEGGYQGSILMLEARQACSGATGRNGGHTKAASYRTFPHHALRLGLGRAKQIARLEAANIAAVHRFAASHPALARECDARICPTVDVIFDPAQWQQAVAAVHAMREAFSSPDPHHPPVGGGNNDREAAAAREEEAEEYVLYSAEEVRSKFHVHDGVFRGREERVQGGVEYLAGSINAYKFGVGLLRMCVESGVNLQTWTEVSGLRRRVEDQDGWEVQTARGVVTAKRVVLATNGYTASVWPPFQGVVVPMRGQVTAQRPGREMPRGGCLPTTYSFIYEKGYEYMVPRPEGSRFAGDIVMGGGLVRAPDDGLLEFGTTDDTTLNEEISEYLKETTPRYFGPNWGEDDPEGRVRREWTGIMGFSPDGFPFVGEVPGEDELWASCSFQGHGMVLCWVCAVALVEMMEGRDGEGLKEWFPDVFRITEERLAQKFQGRLDAMSQVKEIAESI
ncbi:hypothetical protein VTI74DRAFT_188 [Chaetomium olivicolor]